MALAASPGARVYSLNKSENSTSIELKFVSFALALPDAGRASSGGAGEYGRLGHGNSSNATTPKRIEALHSVRVVAVAAGWNHSLVLSAAGEVYSFGAGRHGRLGHGDQERQSPPSA